MKKNISILIALVVISFAALSQSAGDFRSIGNGNWNDVTKWETYNGSSWVSATAYPGQNPGAGAVTVAEGTLIKLTASVPFPVSSLKVSDGFENSLPYGVLTFSSEASISIIVSGDVTLGILGIEDQNGAKTHTLAIGGSLRVGQAVFDSECPCFSPTYGTVGGFASINQDDKLKVIFNTTLPGAVISAVAGISFQDITFNGVGIAVVSPVEIKGTATFLNGVVQTSYNSCLLGCSCCCIIYDSWECSGWSPPPYADGYGNNIFPPNYGGSIFFSDGATVSGASAASYVDGEVGKIGSPFTFPIGNQGVYSPLTISGSSGVVVASYRKSGVTPGPQTITDSGLYNVSNCEFWMLGGDSYGNSVDVTVGWSSGSNCEPSSNVTNVSEVTLAHYNNYSWESHGGIGTGTTSHGSVTWTGVTTLGLFTLGNVGNCKAPSGLNAANITGSSATLSWSAVQGSTSYDVDYGNSTYYWINAATAVTSTSINVSGLNPVNNYYWRVRSNCGSTSSAYKASQFATACGTPSGLLTNNITPSGATLSWAAVSTWDPYTNPVMYDVEYKQSTAASWLPAVTSTTSLSYNLSGLSASTEYNWRVHDNCSGGGYAQATFTTAPVPVCNDVYESNNTYSAAKTINLGVPISAGISSPTDVDWFKVTTPNTNNATLELSLSNVPADYDLYVYNSNLALIGSSTNTGTLDELVDFTSHARKATFYIKVVGKNGAYNTARCYNLSAQIISSGRLATRISGATDETFEASNDQVLYPNPASEFVYLRFNSATEGMSEVRIENAIGQLVKKYPIKISIGYNLVRIPLQDVSPGMYILRTSDGRIGASKKFVIAR